MADKYRFFDFVTYDPYEKIIEELKKEGGDYLVSPQHSPDETEKKEHNHVMYSHGNSTTFKHGRDILLGLDLAVNGYIVGVEHPRNRMRYYLHLDNPEKQQFPEGRKALTVVNNFPLDLTKPLSEEEKRELPKRVISFIEEYNIFEYSTLLLSLMERDDDMFQYATTHTIMLARFLDSKRYTSKENPDEWQY